MKTFLTLITLLVSCVMSIGQDSMQFSKIDIDLSDHPIQEVTALGLETDHGQHRPFKSLINIFDSRELKLLDQAGIPYEVIIEDVQAFYKQYGTMDENELNLNLRNGDCGVGNLYDYVTPENYEYGDMGGYLGYQEALDNIDKMQELYPELITKRMPIGQIKTHAGHSLYYLVLSSEPNNIDDTKPQILYDALHHAREPNSLSNLLFYMWYLLENYGQDDEVTYLVDNTTMFFFPIINPDGYILNERSHPNGGGLWRKNRYVNPQGDTVGVDLNRNYDFFWAYDDAGSSNNPGSQTYRGSSPFSEPETQAVQKLCNDNNFQIALNYHTSGNLLIHPWGYNELPTEEDEIFKSIARVMTTENDFLIGYATETVGYTVNGISDDWMYGEVMEKNKIYSMTPEIGPSFWPGIEMIDQLNKSTLRENLNAAHLLNNFGWVTENFAVNTLSENTGTLFFNFEKSGLVNGTVTTKVISNTPGVIVTGETITHNLITGQTSDFQVDYTIDEAIFPRGDIEFIVEMDNGRFTMPISFEKFYDSNLGDPTFVKFNGINEIEDIDLFETGNSRWGLTTEDYFSPPYCITDSPNGEYRNNTDSELILIEPLKVEGAEEAYLKFQTKFELEQAYDYVQIKVSADGGPYLDLCGELTVPATQFSDNRPIYEGRIPNWSQETICLNDYLSAEELRFKFTFFSDQGLTMDGFYIDDLSFEIFGDGYSSTTAIAPSIITISPNPTNDLIRINMHPQDFQKGLSYTIHDYSGIKISSGLIDKPQLALDVSQYATGNYILQINGEAGPISHTTFIKQ